LGLCASAFFCRQKRAGSSRRSRELLQLRLELTNCILRYSLMLPGGMVDKNPFSIIAFLALGKSNVNQDIQGSELRQEHLLDPGVAQLHPLKIFVVINLMRVLDAAITFSLSLLLSKNFLTAAHSIVLLV
jgi:hypothetical protein